MFWVFVGIFGAMDLIVTHDPLSQVSGMKNKVPGTPLAGAEEGEYPWYLLGGDNLARDVFSRMVKGAWIVVQIAPLATLFAFMVGITLGLPAGYYGGRLDTFLSFLANLILAFPVILLFYLLVTPEIVATGIPNYMAAGLFIFPIVFIGVLLNSRYYTRPNFRTPLLVGVLGIAIWLYLSLISTGGYMINTKTYSIFGLPSGLDLFDIPGGILVVFVSVVFVNSPTVFRIVRGLALDIKTRRLCGRRPDPRRRSVVHHAVGDPAQRTRAADRRFLPAHRLYHHPSGDLGFLRLGPATGKPGLGLDDQRGPQAPVDLSASRITARTGAVVAGSGSEPAGGRFA